MGFWGNLIRLGRAEPHYSQVPPLPPMLANMQLPSLNVPYVINTYPVQWRDGTPIALNAQVYLKNDKPEGAANVADAVLVHLCRDSRDEYSIHVSTVSEHLHSDAMSSIAWQKENEPWVAKLEAMIGRQLEHSECAQGWGGVETIRTDGHPSPNNVDVMKALDQLHAKGMIGDACHDAGKKLVGWIRQHIVTKPITLMESEALMRGSLRHSSRGLPDHR